MLSSSNRNSRVSQEVRSWKLGSRRARGEPMHTIQEKPNRVTFVHEAAFIVCEEATRHRCTRSRPRSYNGRR